MAVGFSAAEAEKIIKTGSNVALNSTWLKLHVGDPGAAGTANAAAETTRKQITLGTYTAGTVANTVALTWTSITGSEDPTHFSLWSASTAGTFYFSGTITSAAYVAGNTFEIGIGGLTLSLSGVAA
jgi:hypothetical protein